MAAARVARHIQVIACPASGTPQGVSLAEQEAALDVRYRALASEVPAIRRAVAEVARGLGAGDEVLLQINVAVTEAATNSIQHAYRDRSTAAGPGDVHIVVRGERGKAMVVHVNDDGIGPAPRPDSPGLGLGLCLMAHEADSFEIRKSPGGGTEVVLHFRL